jgi:drug/metabolite transporter (DMT)-like permease
MIAWGFDNNLTRRISDKDPVQIARVKGLVAGTFSTAAAFLLGQGFHSGTPVVYGLLIGALCFGLSLIFFIVALRGLGAFRTGAFFSVGPFIGSLASLAILKDALRSLSNLLEWTSVLISIFCLPKLVQAESVVMQIVLIQNGYGDI